MFHAPLATSPAPAFDSHPSDLVLVRSYLRPWVAQGVRPPGAFVHAADLYAAEPGELARRFRAAVARDGERAWYFLSPLRTKSPRGRRKARTVAGGAGWWHGEAGPRPVLDPLDGRRMVGYRQSFSFMRRGADGAPVRTGWIMLELRLHDDDGGGSSTGSAAAREEVLLDQSPSPPPMSSCGRYLLHRVCRFDTLAGVAIKYGVEVLALADPFFIRLDGCMPWMANRTAQQH